MAKRKQRTEVVQPQPLKTQKRMRRAKPICSCSSPRFTSSGPAFTCFEQDVWTEIANFMDGKSLVMLAATCRWFHELVMEGSIWRSLCLRDLQVPPPRHPAAFDWKKLYISSFNGSHSYMFRQPEKHIDWMRIGTMQTLDARHIELFLSEGYQDGSWEYELIGIQDVKKHVDGASGAIFDVKHLKDSSTSAVFNLKSWVGKAHDWQPKAVITMHAVAVNTNLQKNEGLQFKYHVMRAGAGGEVVSIRISQQLL